MNRKDSVHLLQKMLEIYSPSGKEENISTYLKMKLESLKFENVRKDKVGNVYGNIGSGDPKILLCGHMDTVHGKLPVKIKDGILFGRGAVDAKSSLAAMIFAVSNLKSSIIKGKIIVGCVVGEEYTANGIRQLIREDLKTDYAIFGEPSGINNITYAYKGKLGLKITCQTVSGHIGAQHILDNAIEKSFSLWNELKVFCEIYKSSNGIFYSLTPCLTKVTSRRTSGGVPDVSTLNIDLRLPPTIKSVKAIKIVKEFIENFLKYNPNVSVSLKVIDKVEPFIAKRNTYVFKALKKAITNVISGPVKLIRKTGTGDMNIFGAETGIPVATYGPGNSRLSHTNNEYIKISEYLRSIEIYKETIREILLF
jgi:LysW-gamma-L-lysine carboxypeptidase